MNFSEEASRLQADLAAVSSRMKKLSSELSGADTIRENEKLKAELESIKTESDRLEKESRRLADDNQNLRMSLREQIVQEKLGILKLSRNAREAYFRSEVDKAANRLTSLEMNISRIGREWTEKTGRENAGIEAEFRKDFSALEKKYSDKLRESRAERAKLAAKLGGEIAGEYDKLGSEPPDEAMIARRVRQNKIELKLGLNLLNKIGIVLIILGVVYAARYTFVSWFNNGMRAASFFLFGLALLGVGEFFHKRNRKIFAAGLIGGGIAVLFGAVFVTYFRYDLISMAAAVAIMIVITAASILLSLRYESQTIASISITGGFLPVLAYLIDLSNQNVKLAVPIGLSISAYLLILNSVMLIIAMKNRWQYPVYASFILHIGCMVYLMAELNNPWFSLFYSIAAFLLYHSAVLIYPVKYKEKLHWPDNILLGANTVVTSFLMYGTLEGAGWNDYRGLLALIFVGVYYFLAKLVEKSNPEEKGSLYIFLVTALTFAVLLVPFQFGMHWMTLGWLIQGMLLTMVGFSRNQEKMEWGGWVVFLLSTTAFYLTDFSTVIFESGTVPFFKLKYGAQVVSSLVLLHMYYTAMDSGRRTFRQSLENGLRVYRYFTVFATWIFLIIVTGHYFDKIISWIGAEQYQSVNLHFLRILMMALVHILYAYALTRVKYMSDLPVRVFSAVLFLIAAIMTLKLNASYPALNAAGENGWFNFTVLVVIFLFNAAVFFTAKEIAVAFITSRKLNPEYWPLILAVFLLAQITSAMNTQLQIQAANLAMSLAYLSVAVGMVYFGFRRKFTWSRLFGLGLTFFTLAKLFLWDLRNLETGGKIVAYFIFGFLLLLISFIYQKIKNIILPDEEGKTGK